MGASAKMMLAPLPPSSSVRRFFVPGEGALDALSDRGRAGERDLVDAGCSTMAAPVLPKPLTRLTTPSGSSASEDLGQLQR
jgi:hypothetical protein